jgi:chromatin segregation and condensation protein Rec8/ScpA/Scc1 (kleisin family)
MMHQYGSLVLGASKNLLKRTNHELMEPLGQLTDLMDTDDDLPLGPDWRQLKRDQRARSLREYWERNRKRKERMQELAKLFPRGSPTLSVQSHDATVLADFVKPFSPRADIKRQFIDDLAEIKKIGLSRQLPWRQIISQEIKDGKPTLSDLSPIIPDRKKDTALKLQFLLEKAQYQDIAIHQDQAFGEIHIEPIVNGFDPNLTVKDTDGNEYALDWSELNRAQREKVITDLQNNIVVLV